MEAKTIEINQLPNEILKLILSAGTNLEIMLNCRILCTKWKSISSTICRERYTRLNCFKNSKNKVQQIVDTFQDLENLPWSSIVLNTSSRLCKNNSLESYELDEILKVFGHQIKKLKLCGNYDINILRTTPNLEMLSFEYSGAAGSEFKPLATRMRMLKYIKITLSSTEFSFQLYKNLLQQTGSNLKFVSVQFDEEFQHIPELVSSLTAIPNISLKFSCTDSLEYLTAFADKNLCIRKVRVSISTGSIPDVDFRPLEALLSNTSSSLQKLNLQCLRELSKSTKLTLPILPNLKKLGLSQRIITITRVGVQFRSVPISFSHIAPFKPNQFPALEDIELLYSNRINIFDAVHLPSVRKANIVEYGGNNPMSADWNRAFPNLRILESAVNKDSLLYILANMQKLVKLKLNLEHCEDSYKIFNGNPNMKELTSEDHNYLPSLRSLKELKALDMAFRQDKLTYIDDVTVELCFLRLRPLDVLNLRQVNISSFLLAKLAKYHGKVLVTPSSDKETEGLVL